MSWLHTYESSVMNSGHTEIEGHLLKSIKNNKTTVLNYISQQMIKLAFFLLHKHIKCNVFQFYRWTDTVRHTNPTMQMSHNASFYNRNVHISLTKWHIVGYGTSALWELWYWQHQWDHISKSLYVTLLYDILEMKNNLSQYCDISEIRTYDGKLHNCHFVAHDISESIFTFLPPHHKSAHTLEHSSRNLSSARDIQCRHMSAGRHRISVSWLVAATLVMHVLLTLGRLTAVTV